MWGETFLSIPLPTSRRQATFEVFSIGNKWGEFRLYYRDAGPKRAINIEGDKIVGCKKGFGRKVNGSGLKLLIISGRGVGCIS